MSGGGESPAPAPSTTTSIQDVPAWEQGYLTNLLGQAQTIAAQPYQQFPGQQVAGFTDNQNQAFNNVANLNSTFQPTQNAGAASAQNGANTANGIYNAGAPYAQAAALAASPQGISAFMSPYTDSVVNGITNQANMNWNNKIMPGVNDAFVGSGQFGSGRNAQVLGQAANDFQTNLSANVANALQSGYNTAGNQAATEASTLLNTGSTLGNLQATQGQQQTAAGTALSNIGTQQLQNNLTSDQALQAVGQQQQQQNQNNLNVAQQNWQNEVNYPMQQTEYLSGIIRGLPAMGSAVTSSSQTSPQGIYTPSPLSGIGGAGASALSLMGNNGQQLGTATLKTGGLVKGYAAGGQVDDPYGNNDYGEEEPMALSNMVLPNGQSDSAPTPDSAYADNADYVPEIQAAVQGKSPLAALAAATKETPAAVISDRANPLAALNKFKAPQLDDSQIQRAQLLSIARGMLSPTRTGSSWESLGNAIGGAEDTGLQAAKWNAEMQQKMIAPQLEQGRIDSENKHWDAMSENQKERNKILQDRIQTEQGRNFVITKDAMGNVVRINKATGEMDTPQGAGNSAKPAAQALDENGQPLKGEDFLSSIDPKQASTVKALAHGDMAFPTGFALSKPYWQDMMAKVYQYDPEANGNRFTAVKSFNTGKQGDTVRSFSVGLAHLNTLDKLTDALDSGDTKLLNSVSNMWKDQTGQTAPNDFNTAKQVVAKEVVKAVVGSGGGVQDREEAEKVISAANSPAQLKSAINTYKQLMAGQLGGLQQQYETSTGRKDFESRLSPQARLELAQPSNMDSGQTIKIIQPPQAAIDMLKKNPTLAAKFQQKYGVQASKYLGQ